MPHGTLERLLRLQVHAAVEEHPPTEQHHPGVVSVGALQPGQAGLGRGQQPSVDELLHLGQPLLRRGGGLDHTSCREERGEEGGAQRLVRNPALRRAIHDYYYQVELNQKFDPWVASAIDELASRAIDLGLSPWEPDADKIRAGFARGGDVLIGALRHLQSQSAIQAGVGVFLAGEAHTLMDALREEIGS